MFASSVVYIRLRYHLLIIHSSPLESYKLLHIVLPNNVQLIVFFSDTICSLSWLL